MRRSISIKKHMGSIAKAGHNRREAVRKATNKKEQQLSHTSRVGKFLCDMGHIIDKWIK